MANEKLAEVTVSELDVWRAALRYSSSDPNDKIPDDELFARVGCEDCDLAVCTQYRGPDDTLSNIAHNNQILATQMGIGYQTVRASMRSGSNGDCKLSGCGIERLRDAEPSESTEE